MKSSRLLKFIVTVILIIGCQVSSAAVAEMNAQKSKVTKEMADKVANYMKNNFNTVTTQFNSANDITNTADRDKILYNIHEHYNCVKNFIVAIIAINGESGGWLILNNVGFTPAENEIAKQIYLESEIGKKHQAQKTESNKNKAEQQKPDDTVQEPTVCDNPVFLPCTYKVKRKTIKNPGGDDGFRKYFFDNIVYPEEAYERNIQGVVTVQFVVTKEGNVSNVKVLRGVNPLLDKEAVRVVSSLPKFKPGTTVGNQPIDVKLKTNVPFKIRF